MGELDHRRRRRGGRLLELLELLERALRAQRGGWHGRRGPGEVVATITDYLRTARSELEDEGGLPEDPEQAAEALVRRARSNTDHLANPPSLKGLQKAAAEDTGATYVSDAEGRDILTEDAERRSVRGRARRARDTGSKAGRKTRGARRAATSVLKAPARVLSRPTNVRGIIGAMFGLVVLYWLLRTASRTRGAEFLEGVVAGLRKPFEWLFSSGGVPGRGGNVSNPDELPAVEVDRPGDSSSMVARWRPLVEKHFPEGMVAKALRVIYCESRGNPDAVNDSSGASGLFQHMPQFWPQRSQAAGFAGASVFDPEANIATAAFLATRDGWRHWPNCGKL